MIVGSKILIDYGRGDYCRVMLRFDFRSIKSAEFFKFLPKDWRESIEPHWLLYKHDTKIYGLFLNNELVAGGMVFSQCSPDMLYDELEANHWFEKGYLYLGYVFVKENMRGQSLGSIWLHNIQEIDAKAKYWLTVEEEGLIDFYKKNDFKLKKSLQNNGSTEWLLVYPK